MAQSYSTRWSLEIAALFISAVSFAEPCILNLSGPFHSGEGEIIPVINVWTSVRHLRPASLGRGDWSFVGLDDQANEPIGGAIVLQINENRKTDLFTLALPAFERVINLIHQHPQAMRRFGFEWKPSSRHLHIPLDTRANHISSFVLERGGVKPEQQGFQLVYVSDRNEARFDKMADWWLKGKYPIRTNGLIQRDIGWQSSFSYGWNELALGALALPFELRAHFQAAALYYLSIYRSEAFRHTDLPMWAAQKLRDLKNLMEGVLRVGGGALPMSMFIITSFPEILQNHVHAKKVLMPLKDSVLNRGLEQTLAEVQTSPWGHALRQPLDQQQMADELRRNYDLLLSEELR